MLTIFVVVLLVLALVGGLPSWGYGWGYGPSGVAGLLLLVLVVWLLLGHRL